MLEFFAAISSAVSTFADFISNFIGAFLRVIPLGSRAVEYIVSVAAYVPEIVLYYLMLGLVLTVVYQIIGR